MARSLTRCEDRPRDAVGVRRPWGLFLLHQLMQHSEGRDWIEIVRRAQACCCRPRLLHSAVTSAGISRKGF